ncbi:MAG: PEGA domain-containing protein [Methanospirillum sp.]|nr:PEGA domain-containing protein [Methanospirillum sp.]
MKWEIILVGLLFIPAIACGIAGAEKMNFSAPGIGYIEIRSDQEGARVYLDTQYMGYISGGSLTIPVDTTVSPQWNNIRMEYTGFQNFAGPFIPAVPGKTVAYQIDLNKTSYEGIGIAKFESTPSGAEFFLDGKNMGGSPDSGILVAYTIPRGLYTVEARKAGYIPKIDPLYIDDNAVATYRIEMVSSPLGELQVNSTPDDAQIYLDNRAAGITPVRIPDIRVGEHRIQVMKDGYQDWAANVSVTGGTTGVVEAILVSKPVPAQVIPDNTTDAVK